MNASTPHYVLCSETSRTDGIGQWRFMLRPDDGSTSIEVADVEPDVWGERLDLLTVVRALESLDHPSRVTLVGCTRYVEQGILYGVSEWRDNGWRWEYFGQMVPVRDSDLWRRMDQVLQFHQVECGQRRVDNGHNTLSGPHWSAANTPTERADRVVTCDWVKYYAPAFDSWCDACIELASNVWQKVTGFRDHGPRVRGWHNVAVRA